MNPFGAKARLQRKAMKYKAEILDMRMEAFRQIQAKGYDYNGASRRKKSMVGWTMHSGDAHEDIEDNLDILRQRSRDLYMGTPIATSAIKTLRSNVIGEGLLLKSRIDSDALGLETSVASAWEARTEREFRLWANTTDCDALGMNNFYELQQLAFVSWLLNGDAFAVLKYTDGSQMQPYGLRLHLIEGDRIATPSASGFSIGTEGKAKNGNKIYSGVEIDDFGAVVAYHLRKGPVISPEWLRIPVRSEESGIRQIIQVMDAERCDQYRGVPFLSQVIETIKQVGRYTEAELSAAVISAFFTAFIQTPDQIEDILNPVYDEDESVSSDPNDYELGPGAINVLRPGETITMADPKRPTSGFDAFISAMTRQIGGALEIPYELLTKSFTASFSASRGALLEFQKAARMRRAWFSADFCAPIYEAWMSEAVALGRIAAPMFFTDPIMRRAWLGAEWIGPAPGMLNPTSEVQAAKMRVENGFSTHERETIEMTGGTWDQNMRRLETEQQMLRQAGLASAISREGEAVD